MLGHQSGQASLAELHLWSGKTTPLLEPDSFHARFAQLRPRLLRDEDFAHWFTPGQGRPSVPPSVVAGAFLLALREGCSDREAEQRMRFDLRWKWALALPSATLRLCGRRRRGRSGEAPAARHRPDNHVRPLQRRRRSRDHGDGDHGLRDRGLTA